MPKSNVRKTKRARIHQGGLACGDILEFGPEYLGDREEPRVCGACYQTVKRGFEFGGLVVCTGCASDLIRVVGRRAR